MDTNKLIVECHSDKVLFDVYVAVKNVWVLPLEILAMSTILTGNLEDCQDLLEEYEGNDYEKFEDCLIDWVSRSRADITDFYHSELDWDYISEIAL